MRPPTRPQAGHASCKFAAWYHTFFGHSLQAWCQGLPPKLYSQPSVNQNKSVVSDLQVFKKTSQWRKEFLLHLRHSFDSYLFKILNLWNFPKPLTEWLSELEGCSSAEGEKRRKRVSLATASYFLYWGEIDLDKRKTHRNVKIGGESYLPCLTVSNSSLSLDSGNSSVAAGLYSSAWGCKLQPGQYTEVGTRTEAHRAV